MGLLEKLRLSKRPATTSTNRPAPGPRRRESAGERNRPAAPSTNGSAAATDTATATATAVIDDTPDATAEHATHQGSTGASTDQAARLRALASAGDEDLGDAASSELKPLRNKQELFDELQRNYRDLVSLVRKVDNHLDEQTNRSERMAVIAERLDRTIPAIEALGETPAKLDELRADIERLVNDSQLAADRRVETMERAVGAIAERLDRQHEQQQQLVGTMAQFRETMAEVAQTNADTGSTLKSLSDSIARRDGELAGRLGGLEKRITIGVVVLGALAAGAITLAVISML